MKFRVRDSSKTYQFWIGFRNFAQHHASIPTPIIPKGRESGYLGERYAYSTKISSFEPNQKIRYIFNWSDGAPDNVTEPLEVGKDAVVFHTWIRQGEHSVNAKALNMQNDSGNCSNLLKVVIYKKKNVSNDLQKYIDTSDNYTELILNKSVPYVGEIVIKNKDHFIIDSNGGYVTLTGQKVNYRMIIDNSKFINITRMILDHSENGVKIINSHHVNISNDEIIFDCCGFGMLLEGGGYNVIQDNQIRNTTDSTKNKCTSAGVVIDGSMNNYIRNNTINNASNDQGKIYQYYITITDKSNNNITVPDLNRNLLDHNKDIFVMQGNCVSCWDDTGFKQGKIYGTKDECNILDDDNDPHVWLR